MPEQRKHYASTYGGKKAILALVLKNIPVDLHRKLKLQAASN